MSETYVGCLAELSDICYSIACKERQDECCKLHGAMLDDK